MKKRNLKVYWFFRSFAISAVLVFCTVFLILGFLVGYARMESKITGKTVKVAEIKSGKIYLLNKEIWPDF